jgi:acyl dehydratase
LPKDLLLPLFLNKIAEERKENKLKVTSEITGKLFKEFIAEVTQRDINNYAAAVRDPNPCYLNDERDGGLIAPPTLAAALTWPIINNIYDYVDLGYSAEILFRIVHYSEHLEIYRPIKPGDRISIIGEVAAVLPVKSGTHIVFKLPALDKEGRPLFTEYIGGLLRGVECADEGKGAKNIPVLNSAPPDTLPLWETAIAIRREDCYIYEGCANVPFPIHTSPAFAHSVGLPDIIYFGVATLAHGVREVINREAEGNPKRVKSVSCYFRGMVTPDSFIRIQLTGRNSRDNLTEFYFRVLNHDGKEAVSEGRLQLTS